LYELLLDQERGVERERAVIEAYLRGGRLRTEAAALRAQQRMESDLGKSAWIPYVASAGTRARDGIRWAVSTRDREREGGREGEGETVRSLLALAHTVLPPPALSSFLDYMFFFASLSPHLSDAMERELAAWQSEHVSVALPDAIATSLDPAVVTHLSVIQARNPIDNAPAAFVSLLSDVPWTTLESLSARNVLVGDEEWAAFFSSLSTALDNHPLPALRVLDAGVNYLSAQATPPPPLPYPSADSRVLTLPPAALCMSKLPALVHVALPHSSSSIDVRWLSLSLPDLCHDVTFRLGKDEVGRVREGDMDRLDRARLETLVLVAAQGVDHLPLLVEALPCLRHLSVTLRSRHTLPLTSYSAFYSSLSHSLASTLVSLSLTYFTVDSLDWTTPLTALRRLEVDDGSTPIAPPTQEEPFTLSLAPLPSSLTHLRLYINIGFLDRPMGSLVYEHLPQLLDRLPRLESIALSPLDGVLASDSIEHLPSAVQRSPSLSSFMGRTKSITGSELVSTLGKGWRSVAGEAVERLLLVRD
jgi:hypothetical protein